MPQRKVLISRRKVLISRKNGESHIDLRQLIMMFGPQFT